MGKQQHQSMPHKMHPRQPQHRHIIFILFRGWRKMNDILELSANEILLICSTIAAMMIPNVYAIVWIRKEFSMFASSFIIAALMILFCTLSLQIINFYVSMGRVEIPRRLEQQKITKYFK